MSIDQKELSSILGSEIVGEISSKPTILTTLNFSIRNVIEDDARRWWFDSFKTKLYELYGFVLRPGAVIPGVMAEIVEMYPNDVEESVKKFADSKGLIEIY